MSRKGFLGKGILSLGLCGALLASPVTSFAAEEKTSSSPNVIYTEHGFTNVVSGEQPVISGSKKMNRASLSGGTCLSVDGGNWCKGQKMGWNFDYAQFSEYKHGSRVHKATAMANDKFTYSGWKDPGDTAYAITPYYKELKTYRSYYDVQ
ncbi:lactococcin 972 family bacteriocin [Bacillus sp. JJ864]|uniref:lactococcin 972 family bacteriocin n=1 Tax=Bacillus sp. JJ864 TaxID=3122975 RepID=UPI002FFEBB91